MKLAATISLLLTTSSALYCTEEMLNDTTNPARVQLCSTFTPCYMKRSPEDRKGQYTNSECNEDESCADFNKDIGCVNDGNGNLSGCKRVNGCVLTQFCDVKPRQFTFNGEVTNYECVAGKKGSRTEELLKELEEALLIV